VPSGGRERAGFYRFSVERHPEEEEMEVRSAIQQIVGRAQSSPGDATVPDGTAADNVVKPLASPD
jgi:hypothetical protein